MPRTSCRTSGEVAEAGEPLAHLDKRSCRVDLSPWSFSNQDDIRAMIDEAKRKAASANGTAADTMDKLGAIKKEIEKIKVAPGDGNLNNVLTDVDQSSEI